MACSTQAAIYCTGTPSHRKSNALDSPRDDFRGDPAALRPALHGVIPRQGRLCIGVARVRRRACRRICVVADVEAGTITKRRRAQGAVEKVHSKTCLFVLELLGAAKRVIEGVQIGRTVGLVPLGEVESRGRKASKELAAISDTDEHEEARLSVATPVEVCCTKAVSRATVHVSPFAGMRGTTGG